jgi:YHS domain-containing protein
MRTLRTVAASILVAIFLIPLPGLAADVKTSKKLKPYPLKTCVVSGEKLGEMGEPYVWEYQGREIKFCCKGCVKDFKKDPAKYIKILEEAEAKAKTAKSP